MFPGPPTMGTWVSRRHRSELYTVGFFMHRGSQASNGRQVYTNTPAARGSLESILYHVRKKHLFVDLLGARRSNGSEWTYFPVTAKAWGLYPEAMVLRDPYDGIFFVDTSSPPDYL